MSCGVSGSTVRQDGRLSVLPASSTSNLGLSRLGALGEVEASGSSSDCGIALGCGDVSLSMRCSFCVASRGLKSL